MVAEGGDRFKGAGNTCYYNLKNAFININVKPFHKIALQKTSAVFFSPHGLKKMEGYKDGKDVLPRNQLKSAQSTLIKISPAQYDESIFVRVTTSST